MSDQSLPASTAITPLPDIVQRYLNGESIQSIADDTQHCFRTIYKWLLTEAGPGYEALQTDALVNRIADADYELDTATDKVSVARAREQAKFARMDFERRRPKLYGPKQELSVDTTVQVILNKPVQPQPVVVDAPIIDGSLEVIDKREKLEQ